MVSSATATNGCAAQALWYMGSETVALKDIRVPDLQPGHVLVKTFYSCVSRGTEGLIFRGAVPESEWQRMRAPFQEGDFPFPVKYGYASVGEVIGGDADLIGQTVFSLYPHQNLFTLPSDACVPVPASVPAHKAVLAANMETALNALWDGKPSPGDHICVVGGGVVGLLTAYVCGQLPGSTVTLVDVNPARAQIAGELGLQFCHPDNVPLDQDIVFHTSATAAGLTTALSCAGNGASVVEMSWYGDQAVEVPLGADFHSRRIRLISSQVGTIPPERQERWTYRRRLQTALSLLEDPRLDQLISHRVPFEDTPVRLPEVLNKASDVLAALIVYDQPAEAPASSGQT
ncbi:zinc-binding alcohol dehydrogenase [Labrenzia sp. PHM005]|uniref:zinc-dependent alcohol dehydrogenase n=1 Tax=Labrenzia sp. PHM005 TaxID=2590016 RepID=UPI00113FD865|nr:zinc-binding alcohol dehydrogenase [Labrenzia sp. PHM005]QDG74575.1 zinc-binding alcohol dehydrogenase [Labrenzia sp. PHM005]